jgi:hypothetical protein
VSIRDATFLAIESALRLIWVPLLFLLPVWSLLYRVYTLQDATRSRYRSRNERLCFDLGHGLPEGQIFRHRGSGQVSSLPSYLPYATPQKERRQADLQHLLDHIISHCVQGSIVPLAPS